MGYLRRGQCPAVRPDSIRDFDADKYKGNWYEIYRDKDITFEKDLECVTATYDYRPDRVGRYSIDECARYMDPKTGEPSKCAGAINWFGMNKIMSWARFDTKLDDGTITGDGYVKFWFLPELNYQILDTDYENYSLVYGCDNHGPWHHN